MDINDTKTNPNRIFHQFYTPLVNFFNNIVNLP